jgi:hypothetical protein
MLKNLSQSAAVAGIARMSRAILRQLWKLSALRVDVGAVLEELIFLFFSTR